MLHFCFLFINSALTNASTDSSTTSSTLPNSDSSSTSSSTTTSTVVPVPTAAETASQYPNRSLRFPPYTRLNPPLLPAKSGSGRRVVYKNNLQWVWVVDDRNNVLRVMPVSGRRGVRIRGSTK